MKRPKALVEWEDFNAAVDEALERARTLQTHFRFLSREDIKSLRDAPTPTGWRNYARQLANRLTQRAMPTRARRSRR